MIRVTVISVLFLIIGFLLGRCSRPSPEVVYEAIKVIDTLKFVDTVKVLDTVYVSSVGEVRLVGCDTASFSWNLETHHVFKLERDNYFERSLMVQRQGYPSSWGVGVGLGWNGVVFPYISIRYKRISGWIKPLRPYTGGVSLEILRF